MVAWTIRRTDEGELSIILNGEVVKYGAILDMSVPIDDEYEDEYVKVSLMQMYLYFSRFKFKFYINHLLLNCFFTSADGIRIPQ